MGTWGRRLLYRYQEDGGVQDEVLHKYNFRVFNFSLQFGENCSATMSEYVLNSIDHVLSLEHPLQVTYTTVMMHLFDNARLTTQLPTEKGTSLAFLGNEEWIDVKIMLPPLLFFAACASCAALAFMVVRMFARANPPGPLLLHTPVVLLCAAINDNDFPRSVLALGVKDSADTPVHSLDSFFVDTVDLRKQEEHKTRVQVFVKQVA